MRILENNNFINFDHSIWLLYILYGVVCLLAIIIAIENNRIRLIIYSSIVSLLCCVIYLLMDAADVAMTEAAIGAAISTVLLLVFASKVPYKASNEFTLKSFIAMVIASSFFAVCIYISPILKEYGSETKVHSHIANYYVNISRNLNIESIVAAILASFRGFDTLWETTVILTAGLAVYVIVGSRSSKK